MSILRISPQPDDVCSTVGDLLGVRVAGAVPLPFSFSNVGWRVVTERGVPYVVKFGDARSEAKWRSAHCALELAAAVGVPVAPLVRSGRDGDRLVRVFEWVEGETPGAANLGDDAAVRRFFSDLGTAVRALHGVELEAFSSRLDGSAPSFARWSEYVGYRLRAIAGRCRATGALSEDEVERVCGVAERLAGEVDGVARPVVAHRDLHAGNLLVEPGSGRLVAILDFDMAEAWDRAADFDKLDRMLIHAFPAVAREAFDSAYYGGGSRPPRWEERGRLVALIEAFNTLPNAIVTDWKTEYAEDARRRLWAVVAGSPPAAGVS